MHAALASTAGLLLEAAPLLIGAAGFAAVAGGLGLREARRRALAEWLAALAGCGCGALPGALSLPAACFAWYGFGPAVAAVRFGAGCLLALIGRSRSSLRDDVSGTHAAEPLDRLADLAPYAFFGSVAAELLRSSPHWVVASGFSGFLAGALTGVVSPCALGALAVAASLRHTASWVALGIVATAGLGPRRATGKRTLLAGDPRLGYGLLAAAGLGVVVLSGAGLVHPRLTVPVAVAGLAAVAAQGRRERRSVSLVAPLLVGAALVAGSPLPRYGLAATTAADAFAGQPAHFTGVVERRAGATLLVRFAITCCRADASPIALRLDRAATLPTGSWATVDGVFRSGSTGLVVHVLRLRAVAAPRDPFIYR